MAKKGTYRHVECECEITDFTSEFAKIINKIPNTTNKNAKDIVSCDHAVML
jgi:hypothetical protein